MYIYMYVCVVDAGEMWIGVTLAVGLELVPTPLRASAVGIYLFIISNVGGNMTLLVPPLSSAFHRNLGYTYSDSLRGTCNSRLPVYSYAAHR